MKLMYLSSCLAIALLGCHPGRGYVEADRATYMAIADEYTAYVGSDADLDKAARERRARTVRAWEARWRQGLGEEPAK